MPEKRPTNSDERAIADLNEFLAEASQQSWPREQEKLQGPTSFRVAFGQEPIQLRPAEFHILLFLAGRPYHAFSRRAIAEAVSTVANPVTEDLVDEHVDALRDQLGVWHDYVQTVPHIGYRFKA